MNLTAVKYNAIWEAIKIIEMGGSITKAEGDGWVVYKVGTVIRIDIKDK